MSCYTNAMSGETSLGQVRRPQPSLTRCLHVASVCQSFRSRPACCRGRRIWLMSCPSASNRVLYCHHNTVSHRLRRLEEHLGRILTTLTLIRSPNSSPALDAARTPPKSGRRAPGAPRLPHREWKPLDSLRCTSNAAGPVTHQRVRRNTADHQWIRLDAARRACIGTPVYERRKTTRTGRPLLLCNGIGVNLEMLRPFVDASDLEIPTCGLTSAASAILPCQGFPIPRAPRP